MRHIVRKIVKVARENRGSTIVGVLAALTFITVVTSIMVKNTGAQSAASMGYGTAMAMHSTLNSGIMATEAVIAQNPSPLTEALLENVHKGNHTYVPSLHSGNNRVPLGGNQSQFFSSTLERITADTRSDKQLATCKISSGTKAGGRDLKMARAFFAVEGLEYQNDGTTEPEIIIVPNCKDSTIIPQMVGNTVTTETKTSSTNTTTIPKNVSTNAGGNNAVYMAGNLQDGNNGMEVNGGATFEGEVRFQNKEAIFHGETFFQKDVFFLAEQSYKFDGNAYFNANITFQNIKKLEMFNASVGVNGNLSADNLTLSVPGDFYINGNISSNDTKVKVSNKAKYTKITTKNSWITATSRTEATTAMDIPKEMGMKSLEERRETPLISYSEILTKIESSGADIITITSANLYSGGTLTTDGVLNVSELTKAYNSKPANKLYEGHLVVKVNIGKNVNLDTKSLDGTYFDKKVIFLVESGNIASNGGFYYSGPNSSTMIYIGKDGQLTQFGSTGPFRGYIYIDETNTSTENGFYWGTGSSIEGAFHNFSTKQFKWNYNGNGKPTTITYNESVLAPFFTLRKGGYIPGAGGGSGSGTSTGTSGESKQEYTVTSSIENGTREVKTEIITITTVGANETTIKTTTNITTKDTKTVTTQPPEYTIEICRPTQTVKPGEVIEGGYKTGTLIPRAKGYYFY